jgi:hypothetical protein
MQPRAAGQKPRKIAVEISHYCTYFFNSGLTKKGGL